MLELSAGRKLCEARLARRMTIEEAAHAIRMRPDKVQALENDEYTRFGGTTYAKGFLLIYSRFLEVDVSSQLRAMEPTDRRVHVEDYQYLNSPPAAEPSSSSPRRNPFRRAQQPPSVIPLLAFLVIFVIAGGGMYFYSQSRRLELNKPAPVPAAPSAPVERPSPTATEPAALDTPRRLVEQPAIPAAKPPEPQVATAPLPEIPSTAVNELIVEALKKTWVVIRMDSPDAPPVFEDYLYPGVRPLTMKLKGPRFFVEVRDQSAVRIRKNGAPIAYQAPGISIQ